MLINKVENNSMATVDYNLIREKFIFKIIIVIEDFRKSRLD